MCELVTFQQELFVRIRRSDGKKEKRREKQSGVPSQFDRPIGAAKVCAAFAAGRNDRDRGSASGNFRWCFERSVWHLRTDYGIFVKPQGGAFTIRQTFASGALGGSGRIFALCACDRIFPDTL